MALWFRSVPDSVLCSPVIANILIFTNNFSQPSAALVCRQPGAGMAHQLAHGRDHASSVSDAV